MGENAITAIVTVLTAIIGVAIVAVLVSKQADTGNVLIAGGKAFSDILKTAVSPVTGGGGIGSSIVGGLVGGYGSYTGN
jgi:hypothetical protein